MKFTVIGGGAVGLLLASYLAQQGDVTIVVRRKEQQETLQNGLTRICGDEQTTNRVTVTTTIPNDDTQHIFICTKAYALARVIEQLQHVPYRTVSGCQNGLAHIELLRTLRNSNACVVEFGALKKDEATVVHTGIGRIVIGSLSGGESPDVCSSDALPVIYSEEIERIVWRKALLNCFINPLTAIMQVRNGDIIQNESLRAIVEQLFDELCEAFPVQMQDVSMADIVALCEKTAANYSSMCVDVRDGRQTEIDEIVGAVMAATTHRLPTLRMLYLQIKSKQ